MRVLIVEDEVRLAQTLQDLMEMEGYTADVCHDGEAGLDNALSGIYDVILLDVMLPKLDGFTVLRRRRAGADAHRPGPGGGQGDGAGRRRRLLPHQAL